MNELIPINKTADGMTVCGRALYEFLEVTERYNAWFERMKAYSFTEGEDFTSVKSFTVVNNGAKREITDHLLTIDMAKEIAMLQRNEKGKEARQYFLEIEREWNSPEKVMARALVMANKQIKELAQTNKQQAIEIAQKDQLIGEMKPKMDYLDTILANKNLMPILHIAKDYGMSAQALNAKLKEFGVQYKAGRKWVLYSKYQACGYTSTQYYKDKFYQDGTPVNNMEWTQKGRLFLYDFLKKRGIVPMIEREA